MINNALLLAQGQSERIVNLWPSLGLVAFVAFVIFCIHRAVKFLDSWRKEQKLIRMELGKLAEEVHLLQQNLKDDKDSESSAQ